jgi:hypothetical protein
MRVVPTVDLHPGGDTYACAQVRVILAMGLYGFRDELVLIRKTADTAKAEPLASQHALYFVGSWSDVH